MGVGVEEKAGVFVAPSKRDLDELSRSLEEWLVARLPQATGIKLTNFEYPLGAGQSHETILFDAEWQQAGTRQEKGMVVRIKPTAFTVYVDDAFVEQYRLMQVMRRSGKVHIAQLLWLEEDPSILGAPFFVMAKVMGRVAVSIPSYLEQGWVVNLSTDERQRLWRNGVEQLAAIQSVPLDQLAFLERPRDGEHFMQEWNRWRRYLETIEAVGPASFQRETFRRLEATFPANRPEGVVWGDARLGNMMIGPDLEVLAVMDWEQPGLGGALHDLGWWIFNERLKIAANGGNLAGLGSREETIALWAEKTGLSTAGIDWYEAFAGFKISCIFWNMLDLRNQAKPDLASIDMGKAINSLLDQVEAAQ